MSDASAEVIEGPSRRRFAIGLAWSTATPGEVDRNAREAARAVDFDLFVARDGDVCQFGLGRRSQGHRPGHRSAALTAVQSAYRDGVRDFVMVVGLEPASGGGYWCLAVRDDVILADGDKRASDLDQARAFLERELNTHPYKDIFAPPEFAIDGAKPIGLDKLLQDFRSTGLRAVERNWRRPALAAAAALAIVLGGLEAWEAVSRYRLESAAEAARVARMAAERQARDGIKRPWSNVPAPAEIVRACLLGAGRFPLSPPGWSFERLGCSRDPQGAGLMLRVVWRRNAGTLATLAEAVRGAGTGFQLKPLEQGQLVEAASRMPVAGTGTSDPSGPVELLEWSIASGVQAAGPSFTVAFERQAPETLAAATGSAPALVVAWSRARVEAPADPRLWITLIQRPGVVLQQLQYEAPLGKWIAFAHLYEPIRLVEPRT